MSTAFAELRAAEVPVRRACVLIGRARATREACRMPLTSRIRWFDHVGITVADLDSPRPVTVKDVLKRLPSDRRGG